MNAAKCTECNRENSKSKKRNGRIYSLWLKGERQRLKTVRGTGGGLAPVDRQSRGIEL